jgi:hypothetical protein
VTVKSYTLSFTISASSTWSRLATLTTPAGVTRKALELRVYFSASSGASIRYYVETEYIGQINAETWNKYIIPYPIDITIPAGKTFAVEGANSNASAVTVIIELIVDETTA